MVPHMKTTKEFKFTPEEEIEYQQHKTKQEMIDKGVAFINRIQKCLDDLKELPSRYHTDDVKRAKYLLPLHCLDDIHPTKIERVTEALDYLEQVILQWRRNEQVEKQLAKLDGSNYIVPDDITSNTSKWCYVWIVCVLMILYFSIK